ncbi:MAG: hypothetical protein GY717_18675 [Rhodobacteraceae bacterium]|nr:hypothetical protein [Paracoccaceae bacterium]
MKTTLVLISAIVVALAQAGAAFSACVTLQMAMQSEDLLAQGNGDWPAYWALFLAEEVGSRSRNKLWHGCDLKPGAADKVACVWKFDLGNPDAARLYQEMVSTLGRCLPKGVRNYPDVPVNHPDFYSAHLFETGRHVIVVSLKDKSALGASFVSLRVRDPG